MPERARHIAVAVAVLALATTIAVLVPWPGGDDAATNASIVREFRIPRALLVLFVGAALATVGATYQRVLQNPIADPYVLGVAAATSLALVAVEPLRTAFPILPEWIDFPFAVFAAFMTAGTLLVGTRVLGVERDSERLVLFGVGLNFVLSSLLFLWLSMRSLQLGGGTMRWLFGRVPWPSDAQVVTLAAVAGAVLLLLLHRARGIDALSLGDGVARTLGVDASRLRAELLVATSVLVAIVVRETGAVGFVGLVVPHVATRVFVPRDARAWLLESAVLGGAFLAGSDALSRSLLPPAEIPIGIVTTLLGGPIFLYLLWRGRR
jgi:ABC-type Fe3+-siderophore transport system permease subunit